VNKKISSVQELLPVLVEVETIHRIHASSELGQ